MSASRWDPLHDLLALQERMNRLFDESLHRSRRPAREPCAPASWTPAVGVYETSEAFVLTADLAGLTREDIDIRVDGDTLVLSGERKLAFTLPAPVDASRIRAHFRDGMLQITIPKSREAESHRIAINQ